MGAFAIIRGKKNRQRDTLEEKIASSLHKQGFAAPDLIDHPHALVLLCPKMVSSETNLVRLDNGDFAFYTGTLIYRHLTGMPALNEILALPGSTLPERADLAGCFTLVVAKGKTIHIMVDPLGTYRLYHHENDKVWSSSFLAVAATVDKPRINDHEVYEYVFDGATYGTKTVLQQVSMLAPDTAVSLNRALTRKTLPSLSSPSMPADRAGMTSHHVDLLRDLFGRTVKAFGGKIDMALTAGYDSRLMLALCRDAGITPRLHVYGPPDDTDVKVALAIGKAEGLDVKHVDKSIKKPLEAESFADIVKAQFYAFDGCPPDGVLGNGADLATRRERCEDNYLSLNGGCGEIYRNFFYLPDRSFSVREILWSFWSQFDPKSCRDGFDEDQYICTLAQKALTDLNGHHQTLTRAEVEYLYPVFRGRYWTARNTCVNLRFGDAATPFLDASLVRPAADIPMPIKYAGAFEAALVEAISPALAAHPSDYGHSFADPPNLKHRFSECATRIRPAFLRRLTFRLRNRYRPAPLPEYLTAKFTDRLFPDGIRYMDRYFHRDQIHDAGQMNRILTLEYLFQTVKAE